MKVHFSSLQLLDPLGRRWDMRGDSAELSFQSFLQEALVSSSGMPLFDDVVVVVL